MRKAIDTTEKNVIIIYKLTEASHNPFPDAEILKRDDNAVHGHILEYNEIHQWKQEQQIQVFALPEPFAAVCKPPGRRRTDSGYIHQNRSPLLRVCHFVMAMVPLYPGTTSRKSSNFKKAKQKPAIFPIQKGYGHTNPIQMPFFSDPGKDSYKKGIEKGVDFCEKSKAALAKIWYNGI